MKNNFFKMILRTTGLSILAALIAGGSPAHATDDVLRVATEGTYKPWSYKDTDGKLQGFDVDIANALCEEMHVKCEIMAQQWDGIIPGLQAGRYDAIIASMSMTPARRKQVLFTNKYETTASSFVARKGTITDTSVGALKGKRIGVQRGSSQNSWLVNNGYDKTAALVLYDDTRQPELDLVSGRIDLMMLDKPTLVTDFLNTAQAKDFGFVGEDIVVGNGNAIAVRLADTALCDRLNKALATIIANGTYAKINKKYFPFPLL